MDRRLFIKSGVGGISALLVGGSLGVRAFAQAGDDLSRVQNLSFRITDALKEMVTHNEVNEATCYFWIFKEKSLPADCPGPILFTVEGESINVEVTNELDENHAFFIEGVVDSGAISPGETRSFKFSAPKAGTYLYYDNLNAPVNRVMGLHGALVVMPKARPPGRKFTPYSDATPQVQKLFDDLGDDIVFPGMSWEEADPSTGTTPFRQHVWLLHGASPRLFDEVQNYQAGDDYPAADFVKHYTADFYANTYETGIFNRKPHFFTINGQSGHFSHHSPFITPWRRVGEPVVVRILNPGLYHHALHLHANHYFVLSLGNEVMNNVFWVDTFESEPLKSLDILIPFRRPPDVPNSRGIGLADPPLRSLAGTPTWPPVEELSVAFPLGHGVKPVPQSPLCYPMHDHIEISQVAGGGNYPLGIMSGMNITGDRNIPGMMNFPNYPFHFDIDPLNGNREAAPHIPHDTEIETGE